jgi:hypothetical protein
LNGEQRRIFESTLNAAQKGPVEVGLGSQSFLRQFSLQSAFPNALSELLRNVMPHSAASVTRGDGGWL